ncbi:putative Zinc finger, ZZ-type, U box domain, Zinc finger, RING/FYVE/PHD-type [Plasmopara halstedii]
MFACARSAIDDAKTLSRALDATSSTSQHPLVNLLPSVVPFCRSQDASMYLELLNTLTRFVAQLLDVHVLSLSIQFSAGETVAADALEWWKEVQRKTFVLVKRHKATTATQSGLEKSTNNTLWPLSSRSQSINELQANRSIVRTFESFAELPMDDLAADCCVQALSLIVQALERTNRFKQGECKTSRKQDKTHLDAFNSVVDAVAFATAKLLQLWASISQELITRSQANSRKLMAVELVNGWLQPRKIGTRHMLHEHTLIPSVPIRAFFGTKQWSCSACERLSPVVMGDGTCPPCVYRCAACNFSLCRECFTRIPNVVHIRSSSRMLELTTLNSDHFFACVSRLESQFRPLVVCQLAQELRRRVDELYPVNFHGFAAILQLFHQLIASDRGAGVAVVQTPRVTITGQSDAAWFPLFMRSWTMALGTLLGSFLRASTMLDDCDELDTAVRRNRSSDDGFRVQWTSGYAEYRTTLQVLMQTLVADEQHPFVVDATLCWLALALLTADPRRRLIYDTQERLDGFFVNVTTMLLTPTLEILSKAQDDSKCIDATYHQSVEPVRVFAGKDFPDVQLHYTPNREDEKTTQETLEIKKQDALCIANYHKRRRRENRENHEKNAHDSSTYYPGLSCHEGVVCDHCELPNFQGIRYKCAFCRDMDLCSHCFERFCVHQALPDSASESDIKPIQHNPGHIFIRIESPIPVFALKHFQPLSIDLLTNTKKTSESSNVLEKEIESLDVLDLQCGDCGVLVATGQEDEVVYKCANCFSTRVVCATCLALEEAQSQGNPNEMHAPGHVYFVMTALWRRHLSSSWDSTITKLCFRRLLHPPALISRRRFSRDTELFYMTLKYLHYGPLALLSRWLSMRRELQELEAFCACDEERYEYEREQERRTIHHVQNKSPSFKPSVHYKASKARLEDIRVKCVKIELHLLADANIVEWLLFYAKTCRWLLTFASAGSGTETISHNPFDEPLLHFSAVFGAFPEHFFFDLCNVVYLLGLERLSYRNFVREAKKLGRLGDEVTEIIEPLAVMLTQIVVSPKMTKNPHLRIEALRSLSTLLTFVSKGQQMHQREGHQLMEALFKRHNLLSKWLVAGLLQFHFEMDRYNVSNNGLAFSSAASSGDHILWGFLPTRLSVTMLLRFLWQLPSPRQSLLHMLSKSENWHTLLSADIRLEINIEQQLTSLVCGLWSDIAKLFDEANSKITTLRQIHDLLQDSVDGSVVVLPFRRDMLDGYIAINAKQLRLTMRFLVEALELTSWFASIVNQESTERSVSALISAMRHVLLQSLVVEQAARTLSFLISSLFTVYKQDEWKFSRPLLDDGKQILAHLIVLVVRYTGYNTPPSCGCSPSSFWKLAQLSGNLMTKRIGDLDAHVRWGMNTLCTRIESEKHLSLTNWDDENGVLDSETEMNEDEALAVLEKEAAVTSVSSKMETKRVGRRFIAMLAKDGRFNSRQFVASCQFLRSNRQRDGNEEEGERFVFLDNAWVQQFVGVMHEADEMIHVHEAMEACLGDIPDQYLDPLLSTLMTDPVRLPSGNIVDRAVIARHLLASSQQGGNMGRDPFTREPLTMTMVKPCDTLRAEIQLYLRTKMRHFRKVSNEDVMATWGLGWDILFQSDTEMEVGLGDLVDRGNA